jgi:hypothetical protein
MLEYFTSGDKAGKQKGATARKLKPLPLCFILGIYVAAGTAVTVP